MTFSLNRLLIALALPVASLVLPLTATADTGPVKIGIVLMHGKGGSPTKHVSDLAAALEKQGFLVANLEMPWSGRRDYDVDVSTAENEVETALRALQDKGAQKLFVSGHSQGGLFALYFGSKHAALDGVIAIAPGGNVAGPVFREKLGESVELARKLIAAGKGDEKTSLEDYEGKGTYTVRSAPAVYLTWFDPAGAMNQTAAMRNMNPAVPVLFIAPTNDYPMLLKVKQQMFDALPKTPRTMLLELRSSHLNAPTASIREIVEWTSDIANAR